MSKNKKIGQTLKKMSSIKVTIGFITVVVLLGAFFTMFILPQFINEDEEPVLINEASLENVLKVSKLSTYETVYNGITTLYNDYVEGMIDCYVSYEATVKASLDFSDIKIRHDSLDKKIVITIPPIYLDEPVVLIEKLDYIKVNKNINENGLVSKAYDKCIEDVKNESQKQESLITYAKENAENLIEGLLSPFINQYEGYSIEFNHKGGY